MANYKNDLKFLILFLSPILIVSSRIPLDNQKEAEQELPRVISLIGSLENVTYRQESYVVSQSNARINCANYRWQLVRFRNKEHLDFAMTEGLRGSWTDGITFYGRSMYTPEVDPSISVAHFTNFALLTEIYIGNVSLVDGSPSNYHPSICFSNSQTIPFRNTVAAPGENIEAVKDVEYTEENNFEIEVTSKAAPKELTSLGIYEGYEYWLDSTRRIYDNSRTYCESLGEGFHLATLDHRGHLEFVISQGIEVTDGPWTGHTGLITRDIYRWGNNSPTSPDIPITINAHRLGLRIWNEEGNPHLAATIQGANCPSLCRVHVGASQDLKITSKSL